MFALLVTMVSAVILSVIILYYPIPSYLKGILVLLTFSLLALYVREFKNGNLLKLKKLNLDKLKKIPLKREQLVKIVDLKSFKKGILDIQIKDRKDKRYHVIGLAIYDEMLESAHSYDHPFLRLRCDIYINKHGNILFAALSKDGQMEVLQKIRNSSIDECALMLEVFTSERIRNIIYAEDMNYILDRLNEKYTYLIEYAVQSMQDKDNDSMCQIAKNQNIIYDKIEVKPWPHHELDCD
ncbi:MAG: hypothetical protein HUJ53_06320 [Holdemanella sp.]|nr:hypothetical protein [Holdemanella sp.]